MLRSLQQPLTAEEAAFAAEVRSFPIPPLTCGFIPAPLPFKCDFHAWKSSGTEARSSCRRTRCPRTSCSGRRSAWARECSWSGCCSTPSPRRGWRRCAQLTQRQGLTHQVSHQHLCTGQARRRRVGRAHPRRGDYASSASRPCRLRQLTQHCRAARRGRRSSRRGCRSAGARSRPLGPRTAQRRLGRCLPCQRVCRGVASSSAGARSLSKPALAAARRG
jgi:hypothetical protein